MREDVEPPKSSASKSRRRRQYTEAELRVDS